MGRRGRAAALAAFLAVQALVALPVEPQTLAPYDAFGTATIDPRKWRGYEYDVKGTHWRDWDARVGRRDGPGGGAQSTDRRRDIAAGQLRLALTTWGLVTPYPADWRRYPFGRIGMRVADVGLSDGAPLVHAFAARVRFTSLEQVRACSESSYSRARAGVVGVFFKDEDVRTRAGDVIVALWAHASPAPSGEVTFSAAAERCVDAECDIVEPVGGASFDRTSTVGIAHALTIRWQPDRSRFAVTVSDSAGPAETRTIVYPSTVTPFAPRAYIYDLRLENAPGVCAPWVGYTTPRAAIASEVRFDAVKLDATAVEATE